MSKSLEIKYKGDTLKGTLVKEDSKFITIKLSSGYNANLRKSDVKILSQNDVEKKEVKKVKPVKKDDLNTITILHTGGTIASKVDYKTGAVNPSTSPDELLTLYPEINEIVNVETKLIGNILSENMNFNHINLILDAVEEALKTETKGVIVSHGTDMLGYSATALQYALENLPVPVILVGAQRSSDRPSSDAYTNLRAAVDFILENDNLDKKFRRVGVCMHGDVSDDSFVILDGINIKKLHSSRRDAFKQINYPAVADIVKGEMAIVREELFTKDSRDKFSVTKYDTKLKIGFFKTHPGAFLQEISNLKIYDGVVIEGSGIGHIPSMHVDEFTKENPKFLDELVKLQKTTKVVMSTQCVYGETNMNIYSAGTKIRDTGVHGQWMNLTSETLFMRVAHCLSKDRKKFEEIWNQNLEGFEMRTIFDGE